MDRTTNGNTKQAENKKVMFHQIRITDKAFMNVHALIHKAMSKGQNMKVGEMASKILEGAK